MNKKIFLLDQLVSIEIADKKPYNELEYRPSKDGWFGSKRIFWGYEPEGFYYFYHGTSPYSKKQIETGKYNDVPLLVIDNKVYFHPYVKLIFTNDIKIDGFKTYEEALDFGNEIAERHVGFKISRTIIWQ